MIYFICKMKGVKQLEKGEVMKYAILIGDGMADYPIEKLGGRTILQAAQTPAMDSIAARGKTGLAKTVPDGFPPGSDVANMSIIGIRPGSLLLRKGSSGSCEYGSGS